jgi:saccharopine dehydrogenase-like NADP-dependent oxidoreductase
MGEDQTYTAMAKTVGLPLGIAALVILNQKIKTYGVILPLEASVYEPVLQELEQYEIRFLEKES